MKLQRFFGITTAGLIGLLGVQVVMVRLQHPEVSYHASWVNKANNLAEAKKLSNQVVKGRVVDIQSAPDLVVRVKDEPQGVDRIPIEVVTLAIEDTFQGQKTDKVQVFHTGRSKIPVEPMPPGEQEKPPPGQENRQVREEQGPQVSIEDDPAYKVGEQYLLFLTDGPKLGGQVTKRIIAPEGRYRLVNQRLEAVSRRGLATQLDKVELLKIRDRLIVKPDMIRPDVIRPDVIRPDVIQPDEIKPDVVKPGL